MWTSPVDPVGGTVITVAYAVSNILDPIRWLRLMTGNADPPASAYALVSTSTTAAAWQKVTADVLAANAALTNLGYPPVNRTGDLGMTGNFQTTGTMTAVGLTAGATGISATGNIATSGTMSAQSLTTTAGISAGIYDGGTTTSGTVAARGFSAGAGGVSATGNIATGGSLSAQSLSLTAGLAAAGQVGAGSYAGGSVAVGTPAVLGLLVGAGGVSSAGGIATSGSGSIASAANISAVGQVSAGLYDGGTTAAGSPSVAGLSVGTGGIASAGPIAVAGNIVYHPGNPPPTAAGGASVPAGLIAFIATGSVPTGWAFYPAANGRVIVGAGSASVGNPQTFAVGTNYGSDWAHVHNPNTFTVTGAATFGPSDMTQASGDVNGLALAGGVNLNTTGHRHSLNGASAAVSGSATGPTSGAIWVPPSHALNAIIKS